MTLSDRIEELARLRARSVNDTSNSEAGVDCLLAFEKAWDWMEPVLKAAAEYVEAQRRLSDEYSRDTQSPEIHRLGIARDAAEDALAAAVGGPA